MLHVALRLALNRNEHEPRADEVNFLYCGLEIRHMYIDVILSSDYRLLAVVEFVFQCFRHNRKSLVILFIAPLCCPVLLIELQDPDLGMGASGTQTSGGAVVPKGSNKRRAA